MQAKLFEAVAAAFETEQVPWFRRLVDQPSHTYAREDVEVAATLVDAKAAALGLACAKIPDSGGQFADHRVYATPAAANGAKSLALVGHIDTVFPRSLGFLAFERDTDGDGNPGDIVRGPGVLDMKSGLSAMFFALQALEKVAPGACAKLPLRLIVVSDEEVGSPSSRDLYRELAPQLTGALVFEAGRTEDKIVVARKGGGMFKVDVTGRAAHAGNDHAAGINAIHALTYLVPRVEALTNYETGVTANVGLISGGTAKNTVPEQAQMTIDTRFETAAAADEVVAKLRAMVADPFAGASDVVERLRQAKFELSGGVTRPPMEPTPGNHKLREAYEPHAIAAGLKVGAAPLQGGGSDANLLAGLGVPCIDGLGPYGQYFHRVQEWSSLSSLLRRTQALASFLGQQLAQMS